MLVDDNLAAYPRQYLDPKDDNHTYTHVSAGWLVPFAGAPAYFVWWKAEYVMGNVASYPTEAQLQALGYRATPYRFPDLISSVVLKHAKGTS